MMGTPKSDPDYEHSEAALREADSLVTRMQRWLNGRTEDTSGQLMREAIAELHAYEKQVARLIDDADKTIEHARRVDGKERDAMSAAISHALQWMEAGGFGDVPAAQQLRASIGSRLAAARRSYLRVTGA